MVRLRSTCPSRSVAGVSRRARDLSLATRRTHQDSENSSVKSGGSFWTSEETQMLLRLLAKGSTVVQLSLAFPGRTPLAIDAKRQRLRRKYGLRLPASPVRWSADEDLRMRKLREHGMSLSQVLVDLGRSYKAVRARWYSSVGHPKLDTRSSPRATFGDEGGPFEYWTTQEDDVLRVMKSGGSCWTDIAADLGRSGKAVRARWARITRDAELEATGSTQDAQLVADMMQHSESFPHNGRTRPRFLGARPSVKRHLPEQTRAFSTSTSYLAKDRRHATLAWPQANRLQARTIACQVPPVLCPSNLDARASLRILHAAGFRKPPHAYLKRVFSCVAHRAARRLWSADEDRLLFELRSTVKLKWLEIASRLGRSVHSVCNRYIHIKSDVEATGVAVRHRPKRPWTVQEDSILVSMRRANRSYAEIMSRLPGRSLNGAIYRAGQLPYFDRDPPHPAESHRGRKSPAWSPSETQRLIDLLTIGASEATLFEAFPDRNPSAVTSKRFRSRRKYGQRLVVPTG